MLKCFYITLTTFFAFYSKKKKKEKKKLSRSQEQMCVHKIQWHIEVRSVVIAGSLRPAYLTLLPRTPVSAANIASL